MGNNSRIGISPKDTDGVLHYCGKLVRRWKHEGGSGAIILRYRGAPFLVCALAINFRQLADTYLSAFAQARYPPILTIGPASLVFSGSTACMVSEAPADQSRSRRRIPACLRCRQRKTKCDNKLPVCTHCERAGVACDQSGNQDRVCVRAFNMTKTYRV